MSVPGDSVEETPMVPVEGEEPVVYGPPVSIRLLLDQISVALPAGLRFADEQPTVPTFEALEALVRKGQGVEVNVEGFSRYAQPQSSRMSHIVRQVRARVSNTAGQYWWTSRADWEADRGPYWRAFEPEEYPEGPPWADLPFELRWSADWKCGNTAGNPVFLAEPTAPLCTRCFGLPPVGEPRPPRPPAVHALLTTEQKCMASELLPISRTCRSLASWQWLHTPVCTRHLDALRVHWLTTTGRA